MNKNIIETVMGAVVLFVAAGFVYITYKSGNISTNKDGYELYAKFDQVSGLNIGSDVRLSGLKVGTVLNQEVDPQTYMAKVTISLDNTIKIPTDSTASISSEGLLGGKFFALVPGAEEKMLKPGDEIKYTQSSVNLEELLGKFAFGSVDDDKGKDAPSSDGF